MHLRCHDPPVGPLISTAGGPLVAGPAVGHGLVGMLSCAEKTRPPGSPWVADPVTCPASRNRTRSNLPEGPCKPVSKVVMVTPCPPRTCAVGCPPPWRGATPRRRRNHGLPVQLEGAAEARTDLLLDGDVEKADLFKHPGPLEGPHVDGPHPSGFDQRSDLGLGLSGVARH